MSTLRNNGQIFDDRYIRYDELGLEPLGPGTLWGRGTNSPQPVLGLGDTVDRPNMTQIGSASTWLCVGAGTTCAAAVRTTGTLWSWGTSGIGALGLGGTTTVNVPTQVGVATDWAYVQMAGPSAMATVALKRNGNLWAWGNNSSGQLGLNDTSARTTPTSVSTEAFVDVSIFDHMLAVRADGTLWASGNNTYGRLGVGDTTQRQVLTQVGTSSMWKQASTGHESSAAVRHDGTLWTWGRNTSGQLGQGTVDTGSLVPIQVGVATDWKQVRVVGMMVYALKTNGTMWAWGLHLTPTPTQIGASSSWQALGTGQLGGYFSAVRTDGTLWFTTGTVNGATFNQVEAGTSWINTSCAQSSIFAIQAP